MVVVPEVDSKKAPLRVGLRFNSRIRGPLIACIVQSLYHICDDAFKPNLTRAEADLRNAALKAKLKLLDGPPHTQ
jgi:hypothetical protein